MNIGFLHAFHRSGLVMALPVALAILHPTAAEAYVGPGAGLTVLGTVVALILALALAVIGFVWYPLKRLKRKRGANPDSAGPATGHK